MMSNYKCPICGRNHLEGGYLIEIGGLRRDDVVVCENENYIHIIRRGREIIARAMRIESFQIKQLILN